MVATQEVVTDAWVRVSREEFLNQVERPEYEQTRCYCDRGCMRIEGRKRLLYERLGVQESSVVNVEDSATLGIPEYWIADFRGLGGIAFIGKANQPTFTVCQLVNGEYRQQQYRLGDPITSTLFPELTLQLDDLMP